MNEDSHIVSIGKVEIDPKNLRKSLDTDHVKILPTKNLVLFPGVTVPVSLRRELTRNLAMEAFERETMIGVACQLDPEVENPTINQLNQFGVLARVLQVIDVPDGNKMAIVYATDKILIKGPANDGDAAEKLCVKVELCKERRPRKHDVEFEAVVDGIKRTVNSLVEDSGTKTMELGMNVNNAESPELMINLICTHAPFPSELKQSLLALNSIKERAFRLMAALAKDQRKAEIFKDVMERTKAMLDDQQRKAVLKAQLDTIKEELFGQDMEIVALKERAASVMMTPDVRKVFDSEVEKLERIPQQSPDYSVQYAYLTTLLSLPWGIEDECNTDFSKAEEVLNSEHFGLEKVKERILEQLAVMMNAPGVKAPILCLVGAPGVGKTSLGVSIARAMSRKYERVALGGLHDEAEIRGHRRTYIGAMPGRIINALKRSATSNPVILLDEIDKIGSDFRGDPSSALLEVLDPEQNCRFHDNYIDVDFDLSNVLFIATANSLSGISQPLLDRMEVIDISGYVLEEKIEIARRHLIPRLKKQMGITEDEINIPNETISGIIESYTAESGVRQLEKRLASVLRKSVLKKMRDKISVQTIAPDDLKEYLGVPPFLKEKYEGNDIAGVVTGLAWTQAGGEILFVEASLSPGKGDKLALTGNLGDVMKESAVIAVQYVKAHANELGVSRQTLDDNSLHIHVPEGAIPKDGPSAGITMATAIVSALTGKKVRERIAMTGEITLRGKVMPVGGIKEKILAAKRAGIRIIILSNANRKDVEDIKDVYRQGLEFIYVDNVSEVFHAALSDGN